eukprot:514898-Hanusia_phi.AAC.1
MYFFPGENSVVNDESESELEDLLSVRGHLEDPAEESEREHCGDVPLAAGDCGDYDDVPVEDPVEDENCTFD